MSLINQKAPLFSTINQDSELINLSDYNGKKNVVLFFYPKDFTSICTKEVCTFQSDLNLLNDLDAEVFGISSDNAETHKRFAKANGINYNLLVDEDRKIANSYDVLNILFLKGRRTFVINKEGIIVGDLSQRFAAQAHVDMVKSTLEKIKK